MRSLDEFLRYWEKEIEWYGKVEDELEIDDSILEEETFSDKDYVPIPKGMPSKEEILEMTQADLDKYLESLTPKETLFVMRYLIKQGFKVV